MNKIIKQNKNKLWFLLTIIIIAILISISIIISFFKKDILYLVSTAIGIIIVELGFVCYIGIKNVLTDY